MTRLSKSEKETIINFDEESEYASISTYNRSLRKKIIVYSNKYPQNMKNVKYDNDSGEMSCIVKKERMTINFKPKRDLSDEDKRKLVDNFKKTPKKLGKTKT